MSALCAVPSSILETGLRKPYSDAAEEEGDGVAPTAVLGGPDMRFAVPHAPDPAGATHVIFPAHFLVAHHD